MQTFDCVWYDNAVIRETEFEYNCLELCLLWSIGVPLYIVLNGFMCLYVDYGSCDQDGNYDSFNGVTGWG